MSSAARKHHVDVQAHDLDNAEATEYATRGAHARRHARPDLKLVSTLRADKASRGVFALLIAGILGAGLVVMLVINTSLAQGAFTVTSLQQQKTALTIQAQALSSQVDAMSNPANLAARATALGMHAAKNPVFINVTNGKVLGTSANAPVPNSAPLPTLNTPADATAAEYPDTQAPAGTSPQLPPGYDPAAADAAKAAGQAGTATSGGWGQIAVVSGDSGPGAGAKVAKSDAGLSATPVG